MKTLTKTLISFFCLLSTTMALASCGLSGDIHQRLKDCESHSLNTEGKNLKVVSDVKGDIYFYNTEKDYIITFRNSPQCISPYKKTYEKFKTVGCKLSKASQYILIENEVGL